MQAKLVSTQPNTLLTNIKFSSGTIALPTTIMHFSTGLLALAALLANPVFGHMVMKSPVPYGKSTLQNGPLLADGSDFPCKQRQGVYDAEGADNVLEIGASNPLIFTGGATHNGGSCQVSLTTDLAPTKNSKWMVIKSIEGGCPAPAGIGNCGTLATDTCASTFQYTIPEGIAPGKYTIAWSWINHTGNREFYMNCGPATIVQAKKKRYNPNAVVRRQTQFPDMFVANIPSINDCTTPEGKDYAYPNPGEQVQQAGDPAALTKLSCNAGGNNAAQQPTAAGGSAPTAAAGGESSAAITSAFAAATGGSESAPSASAGVFAQPSVSVANVQPGEPSPAATSAAAAPAAAATGSTSGSSSSSASGSCTVGDWNCLDGKSYQRCFGAGQWSATMQLAAGMTCTPGVSANLAMAPGKAKRAVRVSEGLFDGYVN